MGMRNPFELMKSLERFRSCWLMPTRYKKRRGVIHRLSTDCGSAKPLRINKQQQPTPQWDVSVCLLSSAFVNFADSSLEDKSKALKIRLRFPAM